MKDKTGREIEVGACVDVFISDIVTAYVVRVEDGGLIGPNGPQPALLLLQIAIPMKLNPGQPAPVYLVRQSDKPKPEEAVM